jgi:hypothetical protein
MELEKNDDHDRQPRCGRRVERKKKDKKLTTQPYSRAGRVEVEWLRKTPVVFAPTRLGVEPRTFSIYDVGVPGESRCLLSIPLDHTRVWPLRGGGWGRWSELGLMLSGREDEGENLDVQSLNHLTSIDQWLCPAPA